MVVDGGGGTCVGFPYSNTSLSNLESVSSDFDSIE
jgi:hypothetical protein